MLAILSFEKANHKSLKEIDFLNIIEQQKMFEVVFRQFDDMVEDKKKERDRSPRDVQKDLVASFNRSEKKQKKKKSRSEENREIELVLAISIILANLSCEEDFIHTLLGVKDWKKKAQVAV